MHLQRIYDLIYIEFHLYTFPVTGGSGVACGGMERRTFCKGRKPLGVKEWSLS
jgi:hypothetical protein